MYLVLFLEKAPIDFKTVVKYSSTLSVPIRKIIWINKEARAGATKRAICGLPVSKDKGIEIRINTTETVKLSIVVRIKAVTENIRLSLKIPNAYNGVIAQPIAL